MAIARTHLESVTTAIGPPMSCLMSTALPSSFKFIITSPTPFFTFGVLPLDPHIELHLFPAPHSHRPLLQLICFSSHSEVFHSSMPEKLSLATASTHCHSLGAQLATVGQLYLAWQAGLDQCDPGWLADGSARYPINVPRRNCGGDEPGVRTVYNNANRTGFPDTTALYDAFCYRALQPAGVQAAEARAVYQAPDPTAEPVSSVTGNQRRDPSPKTSNWTGFLDSDNAGVNDSSEISEEHVVIHLRPEESWGGKPEEPDDTKTSNAVGLTDLEIQESHGGSAHEEEDGGYFGSSPTLSSTASTTPQSQTSNSVLAEFVNTLMKPFRYWRGGEEVEQTDNGPPLAEETAAENQTQGEASSRNLSLPKPSGSKGSVDNAITEHRSGSFSFRTPTSGLQNPGEGLSEQEKEVTPLIRLVPAVQSPGQNDTSTQPGERASSTSADAPPSNGFTASAPNETSAPGGHANVSGPQGPRRGPSSAPAPGSHFRWAIKSMRASKLGPPGNVAYVGKRPTWGPMEAKAGPLEVMTLPTSLRQDNPENYSGQGKDQEGDDVNSPSAARTASGEETEGSSDGSNLPGGFGLKAESSPETKAELVTVAEHTTLSQWQLVQQPTTPPRGPLEPDTAEEARGEILYVHRPTDDLASPPSRRAESSPNAGLTPLFTEHRKDPSKDPSGKEAATSTPAALLEVLTTSEVTAAAHPTARDPPRTDPVTTTTATEIPSESATTEESSISISWVQEEREKTRADLSASPPPGAGSQTTAGGVQLTTFASGSNVGATEMESRSAVSDSFVVGSRWTPFKSGSPKSEDHKAPVQKDGKDASNPFGILVPNWAFGLVPSDATQRGRRTSLTPPPA